MYLIQYILCFVMLSCTYGRPSESNFRADYTYSANTTNYYKLHEERAEWQDAVAKCKSQGAQLFYPEDEEELNEIITLLDPWSLFNFLWIGVSDLRSDGVYETIDGRPLSEVYDKWDTAYNEPNSASGHCVILWEDNDLWVRSCSEIRSFICKYAPGNSSKSDIGITTTPSQLDITETKIIPTDTDKTA